MCNYKLNSKFVNKKEGKFINIIKTVDRVFR
jgi:hypothetical protein